MAINRTDSSVPQKWHDGFEVEPGEGNQYSERFSLKSLDQILKQAEEELGMKFSDIERKPGIDDGISPDPSEGKFKTTIKNGKIITERRPPAIEDDMSPQPTLDRSLFGLAKEFANERGEKVTVKIETDKPEKPESDSGIQPLGLAKEPTYKILGKNGETLFEGTQRDAAEQLQKRGVDVARLPYPEKKAEDDKKPEQSADSGEPAADSAPDRKPLEERLAREGIKGVTASDLVYRRNEQLENRDARLGVSPVKPDGSGAYQYAGRSDEKMTQLDDRQSERWGKSGLPGSPVESLAMKYNEKAFQTKPAEAPAPQTGLDNIKEQLALNKPANNSAFNL